MQYFNLVFPGFNGEFTYHSDSKEILVGEFVKCPFKSDYKIGLVMSLEKQKPKFKTRSLERINNFEIFSLDKKKMELLFWFSEFYFSPFYKILNLYYPKNILDFFSKKKDFVKKEKVKKDVVNNLYELKSYQKEALSKLLLNLDKPKLLWGYTGSGKTEIYKYLTQKVLNESKQILILSPEISLSKSIFKEFKDNFDENCTIWHSGLKSKEKRESFFDINSGDIKIIFGARSAIFAPFKNLGLIIMDEEHDFDNYKNDTDPRYQTKRIVLKMAEIYKIPVILGTATPSIESYYLVSKGLMECVKMEDRVFP